MVSELHIYSHIEALKTELQLFQKYLSQTEPCATHFSSLRDVTIGSTCGDKKYAEALKSLASEFNNRFRNFTTIKKD